MPLFYGLFNCWRSAGDVSATTSWLSVPWKLRILLAVATYAQAFGLAQAQQEVSVDKFTGTAYITIPLHTVSVSGIAFPISLSYAATGVRVDEQGGLAGPNWSVTGAPVIHREVRGLPDDIQISQAGVTRVGWLTKYTSGQYTPGQLVDAISEPTSTTPCAPASTAAWNGIQGFETPTVIYDSEPDIFSYNLPGHSGKFVFDKNQQVRTIPYDPITIEYVLPNPIGGITSIRIRTPEGATASFAWAQRTTETWTQLPATQRYWLRQATGFKEGITYATDFYADGIRAANGEGIIFRYTSKPRFPAPERKNSYWNSVGTPAPVAEYDVTKDVDQLYLDQISTPTTTVDFELQDTSDDFGTFITAVQVSSALVRNTPSVNIKRFTLEYTYITHEKYLDHIWYDARGTNISENYPQRRFLTKLRQFSACSELPAYAFTYSQVDASRGTSKLPPPESAEQDYWGFYNGNKAKTLVPKLYIPVAASAYSGSMFPHVPYRLFPVANTLELPGADRRPSTDFQHHTLAGTLTQVQVPSGGRIQLSYEPHQFRDGIAEQDFLAGGVRLRQLAFQDNVTGTTQTKTFSYQDKTTSYTSGRLLSMPRFAFTVPSATATPTTVAQWAAATVRTDENLASELFEDRHIGYAYVTETVAGRGKTVYHFALPVDADQMASTPIQTGFPAWQRTRVGLAQAAQTPCPALAPVQFGADIYPFPLNPNYDFITGLPLGSEDYNEAGQLVAAETTTYDYKNVRPTLSPVVGVAYDRLPNSTNAYVYGKYTLFTDFLLTPRLQTQRTRDQKSQAEYVSSTSYRFTDRGQLRAVIKQNSDGTIYRTRTKYLSDYPLEAAPLGPLLQIMHNRWYTDGIRSDAVETISEVIRPNGTPRVLGSSLNTFRVTNSYTRPYQSFGWQEAQSQVLTSLLDSTHIITTGGITELVPGTKLRLQASIEEVNAQRTPVSTTTPTGRQVTAVHIGYDGALPVLTIQNARASQVLFSNFETATQGQFTELGGSVTKGASRTGMYGYELAANAELKGTLVNPASRYRLSFWVRTTSAATLRIAVNNPSQSTIFSLAIPVAPASGWQYYQQEISLGSQVPSGDYQVSLTLIGGATLTLDDVLLLPATAQAVSTTYDPARGKTSETDGLGHTVFYEYDPAGRLTVVRDQDGSIVKYAEYVAAGKSATVVTPAIATSKTLIDGTPVTFTANPACLPSDATYTWDFGDGTARITEQDNIATHTFNTNDQEQDYMVTLWVTSSTGSFTNSIKVHVERKPIAVTVCRNGLYSYDYCDASKAVFSNTCSATALTIPHTVKFSVFATGASSFTYQWQEYASPGTPQFDGIWHAIAGETNSFYTTSRNSDGKTYRCVVKGDGKQTISTPQYINYYSSGGEACSTNR